MDNPPIEYRVEAWDILQYLFKTTKINDHTLHFVATFSERIDFERLKKSVCLSADVFPLLKCRFKETGRRPSWVKYEYTTDDMLTLIESVEEEKALNQFLYTEVDASIGPQIKLGVIRGSETDTLVVLMNHMLCDAAGFKDYLYMLSSIYNNIDTNPDFHPPKLGSRKLYQIIEVFSFKEKIKIMASKNDMSTHDPAKFLLDGDLNNPFIEKRSITADVFTKLKVYSKNHGATINDIVLTAYIRTLYQRFGHVIAVPSTVDLRKYMKNRQAEGICNLCTNLTCDIGAEIGTTFVETLEKVRQCMDKEKSSISCMKSISLLEKVFDLLPYSLAKGIVEKSFINAPIAFTNIGVLDKVRLSFDGLEITNAYMTGSIKYSPYFQLAISTFDNKPTLSINLFGTQADRTKVSVFLDDLIKELYGAVSD
jgi:Uncharacterized protein containing a NRPS condensation (elongation) domain